MNRIFLPFAFTRGALEDMLPTLNIPIAFLYGEYDWIPAATGERILEKGVEGEVFVTLESGHHLYIEAADECVACILKFSFGE